MTARQTEKKKSFVERVGTMNIILIIVGVCLIAFTVEMIRLFRECGVIPDTLVTCVFTALGGECGIMGWIKTSKERRQDRRWQLEDEEKKRKEGSEQDEF